MILSLYCLLSLPLNTFLTLYLFPVYFNFCIFHANLSIHFFFLLFNRRFCFSVFLVKLGEKKNNKGANRTKKTHPIIQMLKTPYFCVNVLQNLINGPMLFYQFNGSLGPNAADRLTIVTAQEDAQINELIKKWENKYNFQCRPAI